MNSASSASSLSIPLISGYGLGILRVSSDQEPVTDALTTKTQSPKKNQTGITTLAMNVLDPHHPLLLAESRLFIYLARKLNLRKNKS